MKTSASAVKCLSARTSVRWMSRRQEELGNWSSGEWFGQGVWGAVSMGVAGELVLAEAWVVEERRVLAGYDRQVHGCQRQKTATRKSDTDFCLSLGSHDSIFLFISIGQLHSPAPVTVHFSLLSQIL